MKKAINLAFLPPVLEIFTLFWTSKVSWETDYVAVQVETFTRGITRNLPEQLFRFFYFFQFSVEKKVLIES